jgi:hypothetical protein
MTQEFGMSIGWVTVNRITHDTAFDFKLPKTAQAFTAEQGQNRSQFLLDLDGYPAVPVWSDASHRGQFEESTEFSEPKQEGNLDARRGSASV